MHDYYSILNVSQNATFEEIKQAYRKQAFKHHPDRGGSHAQMLLVNEAWLILSDPKTRQNYNSARINKNDYSAQRTAQQEAYASHQKAQKYPRKWADFDEWFNGHYGPTKSFLFGMEIPTGGRSIVSWCFIIAGFCLGFCAGGLIVVCFCEMTGVKYSAGPASYFSIVFGVCGAWLGVRVHFKFNQIFFGFSDPKNSKYDTSNHNFDKNKRAKTSTGQKSYKNKTTYREQPRSNNEHPKKPTTKRTKQTSNSNEGKLKFIGGLFCIIAIIFFICATDWDSDTNYQRSNDTAYKSNDKFYNVNQFQDVENKIIGTWGVIATFPKEFFPESSSSEVDLSLDIQGTQSYDKEGKFHREFKISYHFDMPRDTYTLVFSDKSTGEYSLRANEGKLVVTTTTNGSITPLDDFTRETMEKYPKFAEFIQKISTLSPRILLINDNTMVQEYSTGNQKCKITMSKLQPEYKQIKITQPTQKVIKTQNYSSTKEANQGKTIGLSTNNSEKSQHSVKRKTKNYADNTIHYDPSTDTYCSYSLPRTVNISETPANTDLPYKDELLDEPQRISATKTVRQKKKVVKSKKQLGNLIAKGATEAFVRKIQGKPNSISIYSTHKIWHYGCNSITFSTKNYRVIRWSNTNGDLKVNE